MREGWFRSGGVLARAPVDVTDDLAALDGRGFWAVVQTFEGAAVCVRFAQVNRVEAAAFPTAPPFAGPSRAAWASTLDRTAYLAGVATVREAIAAGSVYQVNLCRLLVAAYPSRPDVHALAVALAAGNPAPHSAAVDVPSAGLAVVSASPELFLSREGDQVVCRPIKGTAVKAESLLGKDIAENVMIVDMVRNDLGRVASTGSVEVAALAVLEEHPGLVHLVSTVTARLEPGVGWPQLLAAMAPAASVVGTPRGTAAALIRRLEPTPRGIYCGTLGWVDADRRTARLAVAIRTFTWADGLLSLGTGAGITWGSDPVGEWEETELKARRLLALASPR